jgi:hypothetical protein
VTSAKIAATRSTRASDPGRTSVLYPRLGAKRPDARIIQAGRSPKSALAYGPRTRR